MILSVVVVPNASRDEIVGWQREALKVRIAAPPVEGKANQALIRLLAKKFGLAPSSLSIVKGETGKRKRIEIPIETAELGRLLNS